MNIMLRTSGGRGEYELAGRQGKNGISDLARKEISYAVTPDLVIPGFSICDPNRGAQAKPRIRLNAPNAIHAYRLLRSLLLLPKPKRELGETGEGAVKLENDKFSISKIKVDVAELDDRRAILRPTALQIENSSHRVFSISVPERMAKVEEIWRAAQNAPSPLAILVREHQRIATESPENHKALEQVANRIQSALDVDGDYIDALAGHLGLPIFTYQSDPDEEPESFSEEDDTPDLLARRRQVQQWRKLVVRGPAAARFRRDVRQAYSSICAFSGARLPKISVTNNAGVDAAHILPWARYDLDAVANGLCLSKECHWAFDNGILRLDFNAPTSRYILSIPSRIREAATAERLDVRIFDNYLGDVPLSRFPSEPKLRPSPTYLRRLNEMIF